MMAYKIVQQHFYHKDREHAEKIHEEESEGKNTNGRMGQLANFPVCNTI